MELRVHELNLANKSSQGGERLQWTLLKLNKHSKVKKVAQSAKHHCKHKDLSLGTPVLIKNWVFQGLCKIIKSQCWGLQSTSHPAYPNYGSGFPANSPQKWRTCDSTTQHEIEDNRRWKGFLCGSAVWKWLYEPKQCRDSAQSPWMSPMTSFTELENPKVHLVMNASPNILKASDWGQSGIWNSRPVSYIKLKRQSL